MTRATLAIVALLFVLPTSSFAQPKPDAVPTKPPAGATPEKPAPAPVKPPASPAQPSATPVPAAPAAPAAVPGQPVALPVKPDAGAPAKPASDDAAQTSAAMDKAAQLVQTKKFDEARKAYEAIAAAHPKGEAAAAARLGIAQSYKAEGKVALAVPSLEMILADQAESPPALASKAQEMLAEARLAVAGDFAKIKKYDAAIATLQQTVDDKRSSNASVHAALRFMAHHYLTANQKEKAIETYRLLIGRPSVGDAQRLDDLVSLAALVPSANDEFEQFIKSHPGTAPANLARARTEQGRAYLRLKQLDKAGEAFESVLAMKDLPFPATRLALIGKADLAVSKNDKPAAIAIYRDLVRRPVKPTVRGSDYEPHARMDDIERLISLAPEADVTAEVVTYLNYLYSALELNLSSAAPKNDVLFPIQAGSPSYGVDRYAQYLRQTTGRAPQDQLDAVLAQLTRGGSLRPFVASDFSKAVASRISSDAPMAEFLKPLLTGDYPTAARAAWRRARLSRDPMERETWIRAVALAVHCQDQTRAGRGTAFLKWALPDAPVAVADKSIAPDPLADYLDNAVLPFQPSADDVKAAIAHLNQLESVVSLDQAKLLSRVLPDNDVLILAVRPSEAVERYQYYLWRTTGRDSPTQLAAMKNQLAHGGAERPLAVSEESKKLAAAISDKAPLADYLKALLAGDFQSAARIAWKKAGKAKLGLDYDAWIEAVAMAIRCRDQTIGQRDADFVKWTKGTLKGPDGKPVAANPEAAFVGG